jgi:hypothetical protein
VIVGGRLCQAQTPLAPQDPGQFLDEMFLGGSNGHVFCQQCRQQCLILFAIFPGQHGEARQYAVLHRIEAGDLCAAINGRRDNNLVHDQKLLLPFA